MEGLADRTHLKASLFETVRRQLLGYGFKLNSARDNFVRRRDGITDIFQITCLDTEHGYRIQPGVAVRLEEVEHIFHRTSGFDSRYQQDTPTMGAPVGAILSGNVRACEFLVESDLAVASVAEDIGRVFREIALPYFEHWSSLQAIDLELNERPADTTVHRALAWFRCSTGIIVAKLLGRPDYARLAAFYTEVMTQDNKGFYFKRFKSLLESLETVEPVTGKRNGED
jgi:hypothetical protein